MNRREDWVTRNSPWHLTGDASADLQEPEAKSGVPAAYHVIRGLFFLDEAAGLRAPL